MSDSLGLDPLDSFTRKNPQSRVVYEGTAVRIEKPWGQEDCRFDFSAIEDAVKSLNPVEFNPKFNAVVWHDTATIEFIFGFISTKSERLKDFVDRQFSIDLEGQLLNCRYHSPSDRFWELSERFTRIASDDNEKSAPQMEAFQNFRKLESLAPERKVFYENKVPLNFSICFGSGTIPPDLVDVARHVNFVANYYDRQTADIYIRIPNSARLNNDLRYVQERFPSQLALRRVDPIILSFIETAQQVNVRNSFIHYYQVIEYVGFYYVEERVRKNLLKAVRSPSFIADPEKKLGEFFEILTESIQNEEGRMKRVIEECCNEAEIWTEIEANKDFFCQTLQFDGGFELKPLIDKNSKLTDWKVNWVPKVFENLTRVRNCLVHAREKRESKVVLPTEANNYLIGQYICLIRRIAEQLAFHSSPD